MSEEKPHSEPFEKAALALMLQYPETSGAVIRASLTDSAFHCAQNKALFKAIKTGDGDIEVMDIALKSRAFVSAGGEKYYDILKSTKVSESKLDEIQNKLSNLQFCRSIIEQAPTLKDVAMSGSYEDTSAQLSKTLDHLNESKLNASKVTHVGDCLAEMFSDLHKMVEGGTSCNLPIGLRQYDNLTGGLINGFVMIGGPTSSGKTALANEYMLANCIDHGRTGVIFSFELPKAMVVKRLIANRSRVSISKLAGMSPDGGKVVFTKHELQSIKRAAAELKHSNLFIEDNPLFTIEDCWDKTVELAARTGDMGCVSIDYIQLMAQSRTLPKGANLEQTISHTGKMCKGLANHTGACVLGLTQLNAQSKSRDSTALEMHADTFTKVMRGEDAHGNILTDEHLFVWKNRQGERFKKVPIAFNGITQKFTEI